MPHDRMDLCLFGKNNGVPVEDIAAAAGLTTEQVQRVFRDIDQKRKTTQYLHLGPELAAGVPEISHSLSPRGRG
jgi:NAD+ synthase